ncbi:MAG: hypothetical protein MUO51_04010, partial [Woeseiaceae bacterium]|nr:hypothetical protein [Woeseiaceae bacterium]
MTEQRGAHVCTKACYPAPGEDAIEGLEYSLSRGQTGSFGTPDYSMPTYVYETIPSDPTAEPRRFEVFQRMTDNPLVADPVTGEPV